MDELTIKTTNPQCRFLNKNWPVNGLCGIVFNRFYRLEMHSLMVGIFDPACELLPPWTKEHTCVLLPLHLLSASLWPPPPLPKLNVQYIYRQCVAVGVGGMLNCVVDHIMQEFYTLFQTRFQNLQNCFTTPNKNDHWRRHLGIGVFKVPSSMPPAHQNVMHLHVVHSIMQADCKVI